MFFLAALQFIIQPREEVIFINTATEVAIGTNVAREVLKRYKALDDKDTQEYIMKIGHQELNAFALPGGNVYITKALVDILDEDEITCVLAHEVGLIVARHGVKRIQGQLGYQLLMTIAMYGVGQRDKRLAKIVARGASSIFQLILLGYSRQDELLADRLAVKYAHKAGYNCWGKR